MRFLLLLLLPFANSWPTSFASRSSRMTATQIQSLIRLTPLRSAFSDELDNAPVSDEMMTENPCWQDIYDDDCSMSSVYSATFVAGKWIKSMPCGHGIEDCDMPQELNLPATHQNAGVDQVDVMNFLGLKRATAVVTEGGDGDAPKDLTP